MRAATALFCLLPLVAAPARAQQAGDGAFDDDATTAATYDELAASPPILPATITPSALHAALTDAQRATVDRDMRVVTFAETTRRRGDVTEMEGVSLGMLPQPADAVISLLAALSDYPGWLTLQPSYKTVRLEGRSRLVVGIGSADAPKAKRQMIYDVEPSAGGATWTVVESGSPLLPGSLLQLMVEPHPTIPGACLVVHRQLGLMPSGRMLKYLCSDDSEGRNRWWKDCNRHARRLHWALDAAASQPPGEERRGAYVAHYQREFHGKAPPWAGR